MKLKTSQLLLLTFLFFSCSNDKIIETEVYNKLVTCEGTTEANCLEVKIADSQDWITIPNDIEAFYIIWNCDPILGIGNFY